MGHRSVLRLDLGQAQLQPGSIAHSFSPYAKSNAYSPAASQYSAPSVNNYSSVSGNSGIAPSTKVTGEVRRLSDKEYQHKREKGLCFRCDDKWTIGHKCRKKELSVLLTL